VVADPSSFVSGQNSGEALGSYHNVETITSLRATLFALAAAALVLSRAAPVAAQAELLQWVDPTLGKMMGRGG
jgi:hypothetical protein